MTAVALLSQGPHVSEGIHLGLGDVTAAAEGSASTPQAVCAG